MLTTDREKRICAKYSARDEKGLVRCDECPLARGLGFMCKAVAHYNRKTREWEYDTGEEASNG